MLGTLMSKVETLEQLGEEWVNFHLDSKLLLSQLPSGLPRAAIVAWGVETDDEELASACEIVGDSKEVLASTFQNLCSQNEKMIPIILAGVGLSLRDMDPVKKERYKEAIRDYFDL